MPPIIHGLCRDKRRTRGPTERQVPPRLPEIKPKNPLKFEVSKIITHRYK
jgi:hypothetical protein